jgi:hypothetical protein
MNRFKRAAVFVAGAASVALLAVPAANAAAARPAATAAMGVSAICSNGGATPTLCLQNNGTNGSLIANDGFNNTFHQFYFIIPEGVTSSSFPFDNKDLNGPVDNGRIVFELKDETSANFATNNLCVNVNNLVMKLGPCSGSQSLWVASGSERLLSVGGSNQDNGYVFAKADGGNGGNPVQVDGNHNACPNACWGNLP